MFKQRMGLGLVSEPLFVGCRKMKDLTQNYVQQYRQAIVTSPTVEMSL